MQGDGEPDGPVVDAADGAHGLDALLFVCYVRFDLRFFTLVGLVDEVGGEASGDDPDDEAAERNGETDDGQDKKSEGREVGFAVEQVEDAAEKGPPAPDP